MGHFDPFSFLNEAKINPIVTHTYTHKKWRKIMKCSCCENEDKGIWLTKEYYKLCYDCLNLYREDRDIFNKRMNNHEHKRDD